MQTRYQVAIALVVIVAATVWAISGTAQGDPYREVHQVLDDPDRFGDNVVSVPGVVVANTTEILGDVIHFTLADQSGDPAHENKTIEVTYTGVLPDGFGPKKVVASGVLVQAVDGWVLQASDIKVGCSSKY